MGEAASSIHNEGPDERPNPRQVQTVPELKHVLNLLRGPRTYKGLDRAAGGRLAASTMNNLLNGRSVPTKDTLVTFLGACGLDTNDQQPWLAAWERVSTSHLRTPTGAVRVWQGRPRLLGVHAAIRVDGADGELPPYVPRDLDADLRTALTAVAASGGFVLLVGGSSVGKTRALFEAVRVVVPEWWLLHPADAPAVDAYAAQPTERSVVWLDELQRYLDHSGGLRAGVVRALAGAGVVVVATLWPDEYTSRTVPRTPSQPDPYANDRELLGMAHVVAVPEALSHGEHRRAETLAGDPRIRAALDTPDAGFTQVLAAGPALVNHWDNAPTNQCYGKAIISAALDARRVGATAPLTPEFLAAAAPGYLTPTQQASAPADWLDQALAYATTPLHGAASTLAPVPAGMGRMAGYTVADYLHQHARRVRRTIHLPDPVWQALVDHHHPDDTTRLGESAHRRGRPNQAIALLLNSVDVNRLAGRLADRLVEMLVAQDRVDEAIVRLSARADAGNWYAADRLAGLLVAQGRVDEAIVRLSARADAGNWYAAGRLAELLAEHGCVDELRARTDAGDGYAADRLAGLLVAQGRVDEAIVVLRARADDGDEFAADQLAELLAEQGHNDELRARADIGDRYAADRLAEHGRVDEATEMLRARADTGDGSAARRLAELLAEHGRVDEAIVVLRARADAGNWSAARRLAELLAEHGRVDELRVRADDGDQDAAERLAGLLTEQGHVDELQGRADDGDRDAARLLTGLLAEQGRVHELTGEVAAGTPGAVDELSKINSQRDGSARSSTK